MGKPIDVVHVVGARPNFMKVDPVMRAMDVSGGFRQTLIHTGQHYDANMSDVFFRQLGIRAPDVSLEVGSASHAQQTAEIMVRFEKFVVQRRPGLVLVYGDVNSTVAAALVCAKLGIPVGHVEAGLRSRDRGMPEEINRVITDQISDMLFTPSQDGTDNLLREGVLRERIALVGNVMIDTLVRLRPEAQKLWPTLQRRFGLEKFGLVTLHRPSNVDNAVVLGRILAALNDVATDLPLLFPLHPRTRERIESAGLADQANAVRFMEPLGYIEFLALQERALVVLTDSGGIQEESTFLRVPCLTLRGNTERPVTVTLGSNKLVGQDMDRLVHEMRNIVTSGGHRGEVPPLWDGRASHRIVARIEALEDDL